MGPPHMAGRSVPATRCGADARPVALSLHPSAGCGSDNPAGVERAAAGPVCNARRYRAYIDGKGSSRRGHGSIFRYGCARNRTGDRQNPRSLRGNAPFPGRFQRISIVAMVTRYGRADLSNRTCSRRGNGVRRRRHPFASRRSSGSSSSTSGSNGVPVSSSMRRRKGSRLRSGSPRETRHSHSRLIDVMNPIPRMMLKS